MSGLDIGIVTIFDPVISLNMVHGQEADDRPVKTLTIPFNQSELQAGWGVTTDYVLIALGGCAEFGEKVKSGSSRLMLTHPCLSCCCAIR